MIRAEDLVLNPEIERKSDRELLEGLLKEEPDAHIFLNDAIAYLGWSHITVLKRFRRLHLPIYPEPHDKRVKKVRLEDVLWVEEVFLASTQREWFKAEWWDNVRKFRNTHMDFAFNAPLPRGVGGYDPRHPNNLSPEAYAWQKALREERQARYSTYKRKEPLTDSK